MSNQGEYPEDNRVGKHEPHDLSLTRRDLIKVSAATAATAVVYPHSTLAASVPAATPAPEIMPLTLKVNGKTEGSVALTEAMPAKSGLIDYSAYQ